MATPAPDLTQPLVLLQAFRNTLPEEEKSNGFGQLLDQIVTYAAPLGSMAQNIFTSIMLPDARQQLVSLPGMYDPYTASPLGLPRTSTPAVPRASSWSRLDVSQAVDNTFASVESRARVMAIYDRNFGLSTANTTPSPLSGGYDGYLEFVNEVFEELNRERRSLAVGSMNFYLPLACVVLYMQAVQLHRTFKQLEDADNLCSNQAELDIIKEQLVDLGAQVAALVGMVEQKDWDKARFNLGTTQRLYGKVNTRVSQLKMKVNGVMTCISAARDNSLVGAVSNGVLAVSSGCQAQSLWAYLPFLYQLAAAGVSVAYGLLSYGNYRAYTMSADSLTRLAALQGKIDRLAADVERLDDRLQEVERAVGAGAFPSHST